MLISPIDWIGERDRPREGHVRLIDQTRLPGELVHLDCRDVGTLWEAIRSLRVRGAPALGVAAAMGAVLGLKDTGAETGEELVRELDKVADYIGTSRPTAVNLFWALDRMRRRARELESRPAEEVLEALLAEAISIQEEDRALCLALGRAGAELIPDGARVLTHCNAGALATSGHGTALGVVFAAKEAGKRIEVFADETRPLLQGARLTTWELLRAGVSTTLICDSMAGVVMREKGVTCVIVGADRIAANGDTANKIGTYGLAVLAKAHGVPFYVAAPSSTFDLSLASGAEIPIEERPAEEVKKPFGVMTAPAEVAVFNPAFDVTPAELVAAFVTEKGVLRPPFEKTIAASFASAHTGALGATGPG